MPMLEVLYVKEKPFRQELKQAFTREALAVVQAIREEPARLEGFPSMGY